MANTKYRPPPALLESHDVILLGYRGVDGSTVFGSEEINEALRDPGSDLLGKESLGKISEACERFTAEAKERGVDIGRDRIVEVTAVLEASRKALGYERVNLLSASYGTRVALLARLLHHPVLIAGLI